MSTSISPLQLKAWLIGNASYHVPGGQAYRDLCIELYRQVLSERISALLARLDAQNDFLDALLTEGRVSCDEPIRIPLTSPARSEQPLRAAQTDLQDDQKRDLAVQQNVTLIDQSQN